MNRDKQEYDFGDVVNDAINIEINKDKVKPKTEDMLKPHTTFKPVMRRTYPRSIISEYGEVKDNGSHVVFEETDLVEFSTTDYVIFSKEAITYLMDNLTATENKRFNKIQDSTKTCFNVIFNGQYPHNTSTLMKHLGLNHKQLERFVRKLKNKGILYVLKGVSPVTRRVQNTYIINPFISRKRKTIHKDLCNIFASVQELNK